ncbi:unnamed protein product, partial [Rotaria sp. Silwood1]
KCFRVGMRKSSILSDEEREARNKLVAINRLKRGQLTQPECLIGEEYRIDTSYYQTIQS